MLFAIDRGMGSWGQYSSAGRSKSQRTGDGEPAAAHKHRMVGNWRPDMVIITEVNRRKCVAFHTAKDIGITSGRK
ncbi:hypothetical protein DPMN_013918 [Dreissena polymorpha]|uniref:Uncharacterized protein n=1 Tax=Dreissena polymorpha TaxID=45954 RepID=A0A9D4N8G9_DREPO|nr:hypothetical protein DPMN_013918 [Dreissena polymorpha]